MAILLCIETSTEICSVAIANNNQLLALEEVSEGNSHAKLLMSFVDKVLTTANIAINEIDAVCFSEGRVLIPVYVSDFRRLKACVIL